MFLFSRQCRWNQHVLAEVYLFSDKSFCMRDMFLEQWKIALKNVCWRYRTSMNATCLSLVFPWIRTSNWFLRLCRLCRSSLTKSEIQSCVACLSLLILFVSKHSSFSTSFSTEIILNTFPNFQTLHIFLIYWEETSRHKTVERNLRQENVATNLQCDETNRRRNDMRRKERDGLI